MRASSGPTATAAPIRSPATSATSIGGIKGLVAAGRSYSSSASLRKACQFLLSKQVALWWMVSVMCSSKVLQSNASLNFIFLGCPLIEFAFNQEIMGVFNRNCMITDAAYGDIFFRSGPWESTEEAALPYPYLADCIVSFVPPNLYS
ncbi:hypothetical protein CRG98_045011 [Punica granatum]|uniref:Uncharacterized protein n=1 Tax=Punica granatum TaxID=22663 RepID=A0A2I0HSD2_PUNGR|nr:hypothetical protein CRG98_045011 [Punica granatum]